MKHQALFSLKDKSKKLKCRLLQFLFGALRVNCKQNIRVTIFFVVEISFYSSLWTMRSRGRKQFESQRQMVHM